VCRGNPKAYGAAPSVGIQRKIVPLPVGRVADLRAVVPATALDDVGAALPRAGRVVGLGKRFVILGVVVVVLTPLPDVSQYIEKAPAVRLLLANRVGLATTVPVEPGHSVQVRFLVAA